MLRNPKFKINDRVRFTHAFLKSTQADYNISRLIGTVTVIKSFPNFDLVSVTWIDGTSERVLNKNLTGIDYDVTE